MPQRSPVGSRRAHVRGAVVLLVLLVSLPLWASPAAARSTDDTAQPSARLVVNGLTAVVGPARDAAVPDSEEEPRLPSDLAARVIVQNLTDEPLDGLRLVLTVHERITTRSGLRLALDDAATAGPVETVALDQPLDTLAPGAFVQVPVTLPAADLGLVDPDDDVTIHPLTLTLARAVGVLDEIRTAAVGVARPIVRPLETVVMAPLDSPVEQDDRGVASLLPGGRLDRLLRALEAAPDGTATLAPAPHTAEDLAVLVAEAVPGATDIETRLREVVQTRGAGVVSMPYALADVPALAASASTLELAGQSHLAGRQRLRAQLGVAADGAHLLVSPQSDAAVDLAPADVLVTTWDDPLGPDLEENPSAEIPPALRAGRSTGGRPLTLLMGDPWITDQLAGADGSSGWAVDAHRVVVETAMLFAEAPGREGRVAAVVPPVGWTAPGRLPDELYTRLADTPWLRLDDPRTVAGEAAERGSEPAPWQPAAGPSPDRIELLNRIAAADDELEGLREAVADVEEPPEVVTRGDELFRASSVWPSPVRELRSDRLLSSLEEDIDDAFGRVEVPDDIVVTLTAERGAIPVTIQHPEGGPLDVRVEITAQGRLTFEEDTAPRVRLEEGGTATVSFEATALSRGRFAVAVTVLTPDQRVVLAAQLIEVRATAVSRPALVAVAVIVVLLLLVGRLRRPRQPQLEVVR